MNKNTKEQLVLFIIFIALVAMMGIAVEWHSLGLIPIIGVLWILACVLRINKFGIGAGDFLVALGFAMIPWLFWLGAPVILAIAIPVCWLVLAFIIAGLGQVIKEARKEGSLCESILNLLWYCKIPLKGVSPFWSLISPAEEKKHNFLWALFSL